MESKASIGSIVTRSLHWLSGTGALLRASPKDWWPCPCSAAKSIRVPLSFAPIARRCRRWWKSCARARRRYATGRRREGHREAPVARGKLLPRERVERLLDPGSPFLELSPLAAYGMYERRRAGGRASSPASAASRARVRDRRQRRHGQGRHLLSRSRSRSTCARRRSRARTACPASTWSTRAAPSCRTRTRCSPTATTSAASSTTRRTCRRAGIPQIAVVMGSCTAGGAYVPAMSDETHHRAQAGHDLPGRPAAGESGHGRSRQRRGAGRRATCTRRISGVADHYAENDAHALAHRAPHRRPT